MSATLILLTHTHSTHTHTSCTALNVCLAYPGVVGYFQGYPSGLGQLHNSTAAGLNNPSNEEESVYLTPFEYICFNCPSDILTQ